MMELINKVLEMAKNAGAQNARVTLDKNTDNSITVLNNSLDRIHRSADCSISIQLFVDGKYGLFSTNRLEIDELRSFIERSVSAVRFLSEDKFRMLPEKRFYYDGKGDDLEQFDKKVELVTPEEMKEMAFALSQEIFGKDKRLVSLECECSTSSEHYYLGDTNGFSGESSNTLISVSSNCSLNAEDGSRPGSSWFDASVFLDKLIIKGCSSTALERGLRMMNPVKLKSGKYNIVIENRVVPRLLAPLLSALDGGAIEQKSSFLQKKLGKKVFQKELTIADLPHLKGNCSSRYFDDEGLATKSRNIIENGIVENYFLTTYYASKMNMEPTIEGISVVNIFPKDFGGKELLPGKTLPLDSILKETGSGVLVTDFNGGNCNPATGDFSYGMSGLYFENGVIIHPVKEMNITGNVIDLWNNILAIGSDEWKSSAWKVPSIAFEKINLSGI